MNLNDIPKDYVPLSTSDTTRLAGYCGLLCLTAGTAYVKFQGRNSAFRQIPMVAGQELYGEPEYLGASSTGTYAGIVP